MIYQRKNRLFLFLALSVGLFMLFEFVGGNMIYINGMKLMANGLCFRYLGCNNGFFGYDALTHFTGGVMEAAFIVWYSNTTNAFNLFHKLDESKQGFCWKNLIILIGILAIIGFGWEMIEFVFDQFRLNILHMQLLVPNRLAQPTDADTMGDIFFGIFGGAVSGFLSKLFGSRTLY